MNCRPNDMALVVGEDPGCECNIGATLRVVEACADEFDRPLWIFAEASRPLWLLCGEFTTGNGDAVIADRYLVPIRDPDSPRATQELAEKAVTA